VIKRQTTNEKSSLFADNFCLLLAAFYSRSCFAFAEHILPKVRAQPAKKASKKNWQFFPMSLLLLVFYRIFLLRFIATATAAAEYNNIVCKTSRTVIRKWLKMGNDKQAASSKQSKGNDENHVCLIFTITNIKFHNKIENDNCHVFPGRKDLLARLSECEQESF